MNMLLGDSILFYLGLRIFSPGYVGDNILPPGGMGDNIFSPGGVGAHAWARWILWTLRPQGSSAAQSLQSYKVGFLNLITF